MNPLHGRPTEVAGQMAIDLGALGHSLPLAPQQAAAARAARGDVVFGFRPGASGAGRGGQGMAMPISFVERIGARTILHLGAGEPAPRRCSRMTPAETGQALHFTLHASAVRLFDAASGAALGGIEMAEIAFRNVTKRYGATVAVDDASFTVADNEFFCFFGPPLSGKSTILRLILGLEKPG